jgi:hypothetical protein
MTKRTLVFLVNLWIVSAYAQQYTQTIKGTVTDKNLMSPIEGAHITIDSDSTKHAQTDKNGNYEIRDVQVGRLRITASHVNYAEISVPNMLLTSGKELVVNIQMEDQVNKMSGVSVKSKSSKIKPINEMATVSTRTFSVEETQKFAAAVNDPARMALSFAGVVGADDGNNTIVIRGNSPAGMLWRMEGIDIPGPNHFASFNASGGGVSILSAQLLANSDFMTGAFAAEYGNALSGVFDLRLRKGNNKKREHTVQAGFLGLDLATEGPLSKRGGSYLVNYRYSTLGVLQKLGINIFGNTNFQDLSFNIALPKSAIGQVSFFGFGGISTQVQNAKKDSSQWKTRSDRYNFFYGSNTGAVGMTHLIQLGSNTSLRNVLIYSKNITSDRGEYYESDYSRTYTHWRNSIGNSKIALNSTVNHKINRQLHLRAGMQLNHWFYNTQQKQLDTTETLRTYLDTKGETSYLQTFAQLKIKANKKLNFFAGFHSIYLALNKKISLEPRASVRYDFKQSQALTLGYGLHSQLQLPGVYFAQVTDANGVKSYPNRDLGFSKAHHIVAGYEIVLKSSTRVKLETYLQQLYNIPVGADMNSTLSMLNLDFGLVSERLVNKGIGQNYGVELTAERFLNKGFYYLVSASLYKSRYQAQDKVWHNTRFNGGHALTVTAGKEIKVRGDRKLFGMNFKTVWYGGFRQSPIDEERSRQYQQSITDDTRPFTVQLPGYFRTDIKFSYRINHARYNSVWSLDIQNVSNHKNVGGRYYDAEKGEMTTWYQTPMIPILSYKIEF